MAKDDLHNLKCPHSPYHKKDGSAESGMYYGHHLAKYETNSTGGCDIDHASPDGENNHNIRVRQNSSVEHDYQGGGKGKQFSTRMDSEQTRHYTGKGHSQHIKWNKERFAGKADNGNTGGDRYRQTKKDNALGATNNHATITGKSQTRLKGGSNDASASPDTMTITNTPGSRSDHNNNSGVKTHGDVKYDIFKEDAGAHFQKNGDYAATKKMQVQSLKDDMMVTAQEKDVKIEAKKANVEITAKTKITLKVGGSTITIEGGKITLKAGQIVLDGETHLGGEGGNIIGLCGGGCATKVTAV